MSPLVWWVDRAAGLVLLVLLTLAVLSGLLTTRSRRPRGVPAFATIALHRNLALLALSLLGLHVATSVLDRFVEIRWWQALVPATSGYRPVGVGLGTVAVDLLLAVVATSLFRHRLGLRAWRTVHLLVWPAWLLGIGHALTLGTDLRHQQPWAVLVVATCLAAVAAGAATRLAVLRRELPEGAA